MTNIVGISIDKVQTFLYYSIHANVQEKQTNSGTLRSIIGASQMISEVFYNEIGINGDQGCFSKHIEEVLLQCSGVCIFTTSLKEELISEKLKQLFRKYYNDFEGQLLLRYVSFEQNLTSVNDRLSAIKEAKRRMKGQDCLNRITEENGELLFQYQSQGSGLIYNKSKTDICTTAFAQNINKLCPEDSKNKEYFRIAVIKADMDGMGQLFENINDYATYKEISNVLSEYMCLDTLKEKAKGMRKSDPDFMMYPLYIAGDDILFAVPVSKLIEGIKVCSWIVKDINVKVAEKMDELKVRKLDALSISIGIDLTFNHEPIRYYYERVQTQLDSAKKGEDPRRANDKKQTFLMKISINNYTFFRIIEKDPKLNKKRDLKQDVPLWDHFVNDVKILRGAVNAGFKAHHYLYGLLNKITDPNIRKSEIKRSNAILYHLLPQYLDSPDKKLKEYELLLIDRLLCKVAVTEDKGKSYKLVFAEDNCQRLEMYVRLLLLFSDERFEVINSKEKTVTFDNEKRRNLRAHIFNRTLAYLYDINLKQLWINQGAKKENADNLRKIFVIHTTYENRSHTDVQVYQTLCISKSTFHKMKALSGQGDTAAEYIRIMNNRGKEEYDILASMKKEALEAPPSLYFKETEFKQYAEKSGLWTSDYIDALLVLYDYNESLIKYRLQYPTLKGEKKKWKKKKQKK